MNYNIRVASANEIKLMLEWAQLEGWNPGLHDNVAFQMADPCGFFVGCMGNIPIASIAAVRYSKDFGFVGLYIVKPEFREKGFGIELWKHGINYLHGCNIGLDGVIAEQDNYKKFNFQLAHRNIRYTGYSTEIFKNLSLTNLRDVPFYMVVEYDKHLFPTDRSSFLSTWLNISANAFAVTESNSILGYGIIRKCHEGYKIGPLFADNIHVAEELFIGLCNTVGQEKIFIDAPAINTKAIKLLESYNFRPTFETARMYSGTFPSLEFDKLYGITSFELG